MKKIIKKRYIFLLILIISIGFALLTSNLGITGESIIKKNTWDVHFENVHVIEGSVSASTPTILASKTTTTYDCTLNLPGDYFEFTVDVVNAGSIDAKVDSIVTTVNNQNISNLPNSMSFIATYSDGLEIEHNQILKSNTRETIKIKVEYLYNITKEELPSSDTTYSFTTTLNYVQSDDASTEIEHTKTIYTGAIFDGDEIFIQKSIDENIEQFSNSQDAMNELKAQIGDNKDRKFYLKHTITPSTKWCGVSPSQYLNSCTMPDDYLGESAYKIDSKKKCERSYQEVWGAYFPQDFECVKADENVVESFVEFIITEEMATQDSNLVPGTYTLKGGTSIKPSADELASIFQYNKNVLNQAFNGNCEIDDEYISCNRDFEDPSKLSGYAVLGRATIQQHNISCDARTVRFGMMKGYMFASCGDWERYEY